MTEESDARRGRGRGNPLLSGLRSGRGGRSRSPGGGLYDDGGGGGPAPPGRGGALFSGRLTMSVPVVSFGEHAHDRDSRQVLTCTVLSVGRRFVEE